MRTLIASLIGILLTSSAFAGNSGTPTMECRSMNPHRGYQMSIVSNIVEGEAFDAAVKITRGGFVLFSGVVDGENEDVQVWLRSRPGQPKLHVSIYLDEYDQTTIVLEGRDIRFECKE